MNWATLVGWIWLLIAITAAILGAETIVVAWFIICAQVWLAASWLKSSGTTTVHVHGKATISGGNP